MKRHLNKQGSFTVLIMMLFLTLIFALWIIIIASGKVAISSSINNLSQLWSKSILGEFDEELKSRYGLLAFYDNEFSVEEKLHRYIDYSLGEKTYIYYDGLNCSLEEYKLTNTNVLIDQIEIISVEGTRPAIKYYEEGSDTTNRNITSQSIIQSLPSYKKTDKLYVVSLANKIKDGISVSSLIENVSIDKYIFNFFKDYMNERNLGKTYFNCEVEYIITGEYGDERLKESTGDKMISKKEPVSWKTEYEA